MDWKRMGLVAVLVGAAMGTAGCADQYGYGGVSAGYGYADEYAGGYGYGDSYGYGDPSYFGWFGDYYYPGTGVYVYDQYRRPFRWNEGQRRFWEGRRNGYRGNGGFQNNWNGFGRGGDRGYGRPYPDRGVQGRPGYGGYQGRPGSNGYQYRSDGVPNRRVEGADGYRGGGNGGRRFYGNGGRYSAPVASGTATAAPQTVSPGPPPGRRTGNGGGGWRNGRGRH